MRFYILRLLALAQHLRQRIKPDNGHRQPQFEFSLVCLGLNEMGLNLMYHVLTPNSSERRGYLYVYMEIYL